MRKRAKRKNPRERAIEASKRERADLRRKKKAEEARERGEWMASIALSEAMSFRPREKELVMKLFEVSLDHQIGLAKKNEEIILVCWWKKMVSRREHPRKEWDVIKKVQEKLNKEEKPTLPLGVG